MIAKNCLHIAFLPFPFLVFFIFLSMLKIIFIFPAVFLFILQFFFLFFFRDVKRHIGKGIISPADGKIMETNGRISIFMSIFDMHVNLMPYNGKIVKMKYVKGKHTPAYRDVSNNERMEIEIESNIGKMKLVMIAGIFARRVVPYVKEGQYIKKGEKIGIIRFGSRIELYLPKHCKTIVKKGDKIKAGETIAIISS